MGCASSESSMWDNSGDAVDRKPRGNAMGNALFHWQRRRTQKGGGAGRGATAFVRRVGSRAVDWQLEVDPRVFFLSCR